MKIIEKEHMNIERAESVTFFGSLKNKMLSRLKILIAKTSRNLRHKVSLIFRYCYYIILQTKVLGFKQSLISVTI